ncbi:hypothetical protein Y032_0006g3123 [Ancylostoma ceylanicum]|uniref:Uncharacterized protein n=1 Tax=Ancylostoma ceylanicum TaxID=53326 RepID=A0A016VQU1_9BILA|nr:hypothetical protein Y032_0006g3123 [Ancylostoma ceylanicum]
MRDPWFDHVPKLNDLVLALTYTLSIALINNVVRSEVLEFIRCRNRDVIVLQPNNKPIVTNVHVAGKS